MLVSNDHVNQTGDTASAARDADAMVARCRERRDQTVATVEVTEAYWVSRITAIAKDEDKVAFADVFRHFAPRVKGFLIKSGADDSLAEECMQDVMATLWQKAHMYDPARASVATWIFTIARNRKIDLIRKYARPEPEDLPWGPEAEPDQADVMALQQDSARLADAIRQLPEKQRRLIERAYFGDLTHSEIAAETGLPLGTIKSRIRLALERLRHAMS
ncbi:RNA polymerase sigma-70 factor, ECF subfamily [Roseibacterium elongatum DSM 19469]|uniref:RNA polymerase sigma-70 factor, ECF subfamily n=2 Tax=Roseicyclus elongatus TaxID=159346 RepID=W8RQ59_9RHOB|nr:RNA polymerase sigma-70 factor, ECF subfamily [Roseibacterium elongatum DSM 19469]